MQMKFTRRRERFCTGLVWILGGNRFYVTGTNLILSNLDLAIYRGVS